MRPEERQAGASRPADAVGETDGGGGLATMPRPAPSAPPPRRGDSQAFAVRAVLTLVQFGPIVVLALLAIVMATLEPLFLSERNLQNLAVQSAVIAILGLGQLIVVLTRGIDLSVGSILGLSTVLVALTFQDGVGGGVVCCLIALAAGSAAGLLNGLAFVKGRIPHPFIVTLATLGALRGLAYILTDGDVVPDVPPLVITLGSSYAGPIPVPALVVLALALAVYVLVRRTVFGRWVYAIGGNPDAARLAGIPVDRVLIFVYVLSGLCAALAGLLIAGRTGSGYPNAGDTFELDAIAAVFIGGASFLGGRGSVLNALVGALVIGTIRNGLDLQGVGPYWQLIGVGMIIYGAVQLDVVRSRLETRLRVLNARGAEAGS
jgi:ribose transport system permease protein